MKQRFWIGSYAEPSEEGIVRFCLDLEAGTLEKEAAYAGLRTPSWISLHPSGQMLYAVEKVVPEGAVHALQVEEHGLTRLVTRSTGAKGPTHLCVDEAHGLLFAAHYASGTLTVFPLGPDGTPGERIQRICHAGRGVHPKRQEGAHIHFSAVRNRDLCAVDLGLDEVRLYGIGGGELPLTDRGRRLRFPPGSGPRHMAFSGAHPDLLYGICELSCEIAVFQELNGAFCLRQKTSTLPAGVQVENTASAIRITGDLLLAGNRGHDSIGVWRIGADGCLGEGRFFACGGRTPWDFDVLGDAVVVANRDSDSIAVLRLNRAEGTLEETGIRAAAIRPSCIAVCPAEHA